MNEELNTPQTYIKKQKKLKLKRRIRHKVALRVKILSRGFRIW